MWFYHVHLLPAVLDILPSFMLLSIVCSAAFVIFLEYKYVIKLPCFIRGTEKKVTATNICNKTVAMGTHLQYLHNVINPLFGPCEKCLGKNEHLNLLVGWGMSEWE